MFADPANGSHELLVSPCRSSSSSAAGGGGGCGGGGCGGGGSSGGGGRVRAATGQLVAVSGASVSGLDVARADPKARELNVSPA